MHTQNRTCWNIEFLRGANGFECYSICVTNSSLTGLATRDLTNRPSFASPAQLSVACSIHV